MAKSIKLFFITNSTGNNRGFFLKNLKKLKKKKKKKLGFLPMFFRNRETSALIIRKNTEKNTLTSGRNTLTSLFNKVARWTT